MGRGIWFRSFGKVIVGTSWSLGVEDTRGRGLFSQRTSWELEDGVGLTSPARLLRILDPRNTSFNSIRRGCLSAPNGGSWDWGREGALRAG